MYRLPDTSSTLLHLVRGLSAQAVLVGHLWSMLGLVKWLQPPMFAYVQNIAVVIFFLLSGSLITYAVLSKPAYTFRDYFVDRFARIYSGLVPALLLILCIDLVLMKINHYEHHAGFNVQSFVGSRLMVQDLPKIAALFGITSFGSGRILWTLAVEWWLYMLFGWVVLARGSRYFWPVLLILTPIPLFNLVEGRGNGLTAVWLVGAGAFMVIRQGWLARAPKVPCAVAAVAFLAAVALRLYIKKDAYDVLVAMLLAGSLLALLSAARDASLPRKPVLFLADYSFTLYLVHLSVCELVVAATDLPPWTTFWLALVVANAVALAVAAPTEMQHRRLAAFIKARQRKAVPGAGYGASSAP